MLSKALIRLAPSDSEFTEIPIKYLPLYNYDFDSDYPPEGRALKDAIAKVDAVLFGQPRRQPLDSGPLKNAIYWASRPWGTNSFTRKPSESSGPRREHRDARLDSRAFELCSAYWNSPLCPCNRGYITFEHERVQRRWRDLR